MSTLLALLATTLPSAAVAQPLPADGFVIHADRIVVDEASVRGEGSVRAVLLGGAIEAARFDLALDGSGAIIEQGRWDHPDGRLSFQRLELSAEGMVRLDGAELSLCGCEGDHQPWSVRAWRVRVEPERGAVFVGGVLRVAGCPLLLIPAGVLPLGPRRSGLLAPRVGWTPDGLELGQPVYLTLGSSADWTLEPIWRQERGFRLGNELRWAQQGGSGELSVVGGWDAEESALRGMFDIEHGYVDRDLRVAASGSWASDMRYRDDFELDFTRRQQSFHELRSTVGLGPVRIEHDLFQADADELLGVAQPVEQRLLGLVYSRPAMDAGPISPLAWLDLELGGTGYELFEPSDLTLRAWGGLGLRAGRPVGPLETEALILGQGGLFGFAPAPRSPGAAAPAEGGRQAGLEGDLRAEARAVLPMWADHGRWRHLLRPGLVVGGGVSAAQDIPTGWSPRVEELPLWSVGPTVESRWLSSTAAPIHLRLEAPWSDEGLAPRAQAWWSEGPWWGSLQASGRWQPGDAPNGGFAWLEAGRRAEALSVAAGWVAVQDAGDADQISARLAWRLPLGADRWEPRARARWSLADAAFVEQHLGLYFASRCDCLGVELGATWAEDREWPTMGVRLDLGR